MATNTCVPFWVFGEDVTGSCSAAVTGKRFVAISGARVGEQLRIAHAGAGTRALGVSAHDAPVDGLVNVLRQGQIVPVTAGAAITAGQDIEVGAAGKAIPHAAGTVVGYAADDAANNTDAAIVLL
jgi:hypothetical protein